MTDLTPAANGVKYNKRSEYSHCIRRIRLLAQYLDNYNFFGSNTLPHFKVSVISQAAHSSVDVAVSYVLKLDCRGRHTCALILNSKCCTVTTTGHEL